MDALAQPPRDARVSVGADALSIHLSPWLVDRGKHDGAVMGFLGLLGGALGHQLSRGEARLGAFVLALLWLGADLAMGTAASCGLAGLGIAGALLWLVVATWRDHARASQELDLVVSRFALRLEWRQGDTVQRQERVSLKDIGKVETRSVGYQRKHVVAHVHGRAPLVIPVERESDEVAAWLTDLLAGLGRRAREQEGAPWDVPAELRALLER